MQWIQVAASAAFTALVGLATSSAAPPPTPKQQGSVQGKSDDDVPRCAKAWDRCMRPCFSRMSYCYGHCIKAGNGKGAIHDCIVGCDKARSKCERDEKCVPC